MCVTVKANALNEERMSTFVPTTALLWHSHSTWQRLEDSRNALVVSCGDVQLGDRGRSKETLRALACRRFSSSLSEGALWALHILLSIWRCDDGSSNKKKKKKKKRQRRLPLHEKDLLRVDANVGSKIFSQVRSLAADRVSLLVSKRQNNHLAPSCRLSLKKLLRPYQLGHDRSAVNIQRCAACPWISAIFPGGRHYFPPHKMAKKNHWLSWHSRFKFMTQICLIFVPWGLWVRTIPQPVFGGQWTSSEPSCRCWRAPHQASQSARVSDDRVREN